MSIDVGTTLVARPAAGTRTCGHPRIDPSTHTDRRPPLITDFAAQNGTTLLSDTHGWIRIAGPGRPSLLPAEVEALREFLQAQNDTALGRWRWPAQPAYVVYPETSGEGVRVWHESTATLVRLNRTGAGTGRYESARAALAYFAAHDPDAADTDPQRYEDES